MTKSIVWKDLHDATIKKIEVTWETGEITIILKTGLHQYPDVRINCFNAVNIICPRYCPWGMSVSINEIREFSLKSGESSKRLEIEIQSGDTIIIDALNFEICSEAPSIY